MELRCISFELEKKDDHFLLEPHGDHQIGSKLVDYNKIEERVNALKNEKNRYTIIMGDIIDNINAYAGGTIDRRWSVDVVDNDLDTVEKQSDKFSELYSPVKDKILGILSGNHEWKTIDRYRFEKEFCKPLGVPYLGYMCMLHLSFTHKKQPIGEFEVWACHGSYAGMQVGGGINRLKQLSAQYRADIYLHAHTHDKMFYTDFQYYHDKKHNDIVTATKLYLMTGTFQKSHVKGVDSYIERSPKPRTSKVGTLTIDLDPLNNKIHVHE